MTRGRCVANCKVLQKRFSQNSGITKKMKSGMNIYKQRDIVLVPFPFSNLSGQKVRPVLIVSNDVYNQQSADVVVCGLTTNLRPAPYSIIIDVTDVEQLGTLRHKSKIKIDAIASLEQSLLIKQIARLKLSLFKQVIAQLEDLIELPSS
ncbi:MAG: type II toxin-antitoxin system PemK/MazF family toxin [Nitrospinota bacterium]|nr:MAG: type II toxin-antitoxin system PemK/MazF family toxin [Nitrospinota bacterium]